MRFNKTTAFTTHVKPSVKHIVFFKFCVYLISYIRLFTKLNLFEILFYGRFIRTEISRSMVLLTGLIATADTIFMVVFVPFHHTTH